MPDLVHPATGPLHSEYGPIAAASRRTASSNPNTQQIPREREVRACVTAAEGRMLAIANHYQVELWIAAGDSRDQQMIDAFLKGEDIHRQTASLVAGKRPGEVTKAERQMAKAVNSGIVYGMGTAGLQHYAPDS